MIGPVTRAVKSAFARLGEAADYTPDGGASVPIRILRRITAPSVDLYSRPAVLDGIEILALISDVAEPKQGDRIVIGDQHYGLTEDAFPDQMNIYWSIMAVSVAAPD